jgi:hypothetical protein
MQDYSSKISPESMNFPGASGKAIYCFQESDLPKIK